MIKTKPSKKIELVTFKESHDHAYLAYIWQILAFVKLTQKAIFPEFHRQVLLEHCQLDWLSVCDDQIVKKEAVIVKSK